MTHRPAGRCLVVVTVKGPGQIEHPRGTVLYPPCPKGSPQREVVDVAEATIEERQLLKTLHWYDGFVIGLCQPAFLLGSLGFTLATIGAWGSILLWGISATVGLVQNFIYAETAAMFPDKPGGISLYAHEGWRSRFNLFGPIAAFGYWIGWSVVLSFVGNIVGALIVAEWFPKS